MYDEEKCLRTGAFKSLLPGEAGMLPLLTRGLRRNDAEVVRFDVKRRCFPFEHFPPELDEI